MTQPQEQEQHKGLDALKAYIAYRTLQHANDQESIAAWLALQMYPLWMIQKFDQLDTTTPLWTSAVLPLVKTAYLQSQRVAAVWASDVAYAAQPLDAPLPMVVPDVQLPERVPRARFDTTLIPNNVLNFPDLTEPITFDDFPQGDVATSLVINGNYEIKTRMPGNEDDLMVSGLHNSSGAGVRQAMNGGRNVSGQVVYFDRRVVGYARVTDGNPCWFCALLASRGAVFKKDSFDTGKRVNPWNGALTSADKEFTAPKDGPDLPEGFSNVAKVHNHCRCQLRPVYKNERVAGTHPSDPIRDEEAQYYFDQWVKVTEANRQLSNKKQAQVFRDQYKPFVREDADAEVTDIRKELEDRAQALSDNGFAAIDPQVEWTRNQLSQLA